MSKFIVGSSDKTYEALQAAGVITDKPEDVARVIIDLKAGSPATVYVQKFADTKLIDVILAGGIELAEGDS